MYLVLLAEYLAKKSPRVDQKISRDSIAYRSFMGHLYPQEQHSMTRAAL